MEFKGVRVVRVIECMWIGLIEHAFWFAHPAAMVVRLIPAEIPLLSVAFLFLHRPRKNPLNGIVEHKLYIL